MRRSPGRAIGRFPSSGSPDACASRWRTVAPGGPAGSSRSTTPSSAATRTASAVRSFVTDAQAKARSTSPRTATSRGLTTATATLAAGHVSTCSRACKTGDTSAPVERRLVSSGSPYEPVVGYSRAVRVGPHVFVAGTAPIMPDGADPPKDAYGQAKRCFEIILAALEEADA